MDPSPWVSIGFFVTGVGSLLTNVVLGIRGATRADNDANLDRLKATLTAQGEWIATLDRRVQAAESHAARCDKNLAALNVFIREQGLTPP